MDIDYILPFGKLKTLQDLSPEELEEYFKSIGESDNEHNLSGDVSTD